MLKVGIRSGVRTRLRRDDPDLTADMMTEAAETEAGSGGGHVMMKHVKSPLT